MGDIYPHFPGPGRIQKSSLLLASVLMVWCIFYGSRGTHK